MSDNKVLRTMRHQAWERALGELNSMLQTYWSDDEEDKYIKMKTAINDFKKLVNDSGCAE